MGKKLKLKKLGVALDFTPPEPFYAHVFELQGAIRDAPGLFLPLYCVCTAALHNEVCMALRKSRKE